MMQPGPRNLITDVPGLRVGNATDPWLKSGVTVLVGDAPFVAGVDVRGGGPGTRETDLLAPGRLVATVDALVLAGGSAFGLDAASGVVDRLRALGPRLRVGPPRGAAGADRAGGDPVRPRQRRRQGVAGEPLSGAGRAAFDAAAAGFRARLARARGPGR